MLCACFKAVRIILFDLQPDAGGLSEKGEVFRCLPSNSKSTYLGHAVSMGQAKEETDCQSE